MAKEKEHKKRMSDGEVNDFAFKKLTDDLGDIEADGMFNKEDPQPASQESTESTTVTGPGYSIEIKHNMDGQQTKAEPKVEDEDKEKLEFGKLGK